MASKRDVGPIMAALRDIFLGRKNVNTLRFRDQIACRTQPPPNLPEGPHHRLSGNYYYTRDARREVTPPILVVEGGKHKAISEGKEVPCAVSRTPGQVFMWD